MSNTPCVRCSRPVAPPAAGELCETCRRHETDRLSFLRAPEDTPFLITPAADPDPLAPTQKIGQLESSPPPVLPGYDIRDSLGGGGMGVVYLAHEADADRLVALKFVRAAADPAARERFRVEVRAMARLDHPNVARVFAVELDRPDPFFTMEYVDGLGLDRRLSRDGPLPAAEAAQVMEQVARAVQHAHDEGVVHRDLKPGNVIVGSDGVPKVTDFGLAKRTDAADGLTVCDAVLGTPGFMAPEQTGGRNEEVGPAADVYGLGATLYALLTGRPPFSGPNPVEVAIRARTEPPTPPRSLRVDVPAELEAVCLKCLEKDPADRYGSAAAVADELNRWRWGEPTEARPLTRLAHARRRLRRNWRAAAAVGLVLAAALATSASAPFRAARAKTGEETVAEIRRELAAGRPVVLVGETGPPRYHRWALEQGELVTPADGTFGFLNRLDTLLELMPDPGIDRYRISAEVRQLEAVSQREGAPLTGYSVGVYFGYDFQLAPDGVRIHSFSSVAAADYRPNPAGPVPGEITYHDHLVVQPRLVGRGGCSMDVAHVPSDPVAMLPGPWRHFEVELTPDRIRVDFGQPFGKTVEHDSDAIQARIVALQTKLLTPPLSRFVQGVGLPAWSPRRPFGLRVVGASTAVRNVVVTPLPLPQL